MNIKRLTLIAVLTLLLAVASAPAHGQNVTSDLLSRINNLRASLGLAPYALNGALASAAQNQAQWMAQTGQISHTQDSGSTPSSRAQAAGYQSSWVSENIYMGSNATAASAFAWWSNSPIHYRGMTNANYSEIGIGWASGPAFNGSTAFVLVFGNPGGYTAPAVSSGGSRGGAARGLPPYVVGVDNSGYIMHEVQAGHTMGEIALIYGYTWDDLPEIRTINDLTEEQARNRLEVGSILLIPPWEGTYTPTPGGPGPDAEQAAAGAVAADSPSDASPADVAVVASVTPSPTATSQPTATPAGVATSAVVPEWVVETTIAEDAARATATQVAQLGTQIAAPAVAETVQNPPTVEGGSSWTAATVTPTPGGAGVAVAAVNPPPEVASASLPEETGDAGVSPVWIALIASVVGVLIGFGISMLRR